MVWFDVEEKSTSKWSWIRIRIRIRTRRGIQNNNNNNTMVQSTHDVIIYISNMEAKFNG